MSSIVDFFLQVLRSVLKSASAPDSASAAEKIATLTISVVGTLLFSFVFWKLSAATSHEIVIRIALGFCVLVVGPLGFYFRDRWE